MKGGGEGKRGRDKGEEDREIEKEGRGKIDEQENGKGK